jgi:hypothetical protein
MTLALLITAATGAWADSFSTEAYTADATLSAVSVTGNTTLTIKEGVTVTVNKGLIIGSGATLTVTGGGTLVVNGTTGANGADGNYPGEEGFPAIGGSGQLAIANATITATGGAGGNGGYDEYCSQWGGDGAPAVSGVSISIQTGSLTAIGGAGGIGGESTFYHNKYPDGETAKAFSSFPNISDATLSYSTDNVTYTKYESGNTTLYRYMKIEPLDGPKVTTNAAEEGATFTEASFTMPTSDATVEYELVRDMSIQMTATMGDGTDGLRYRVKKAQQGEGYEPADMDMMQVLTLVAVNDGIEQKALTLNQDYYCRIYKLDEQTLQPEGDGVELADFDFAPGLYALKAFAKDDSDYDGETDLSNTFQLFQGYPVEIAAQSFATYYSDEALTLEDSFAETAGLYTVSEVTPTEAVLSEKIDVMPKRTPMLIYNESETAQQILLIPTADVAPLTDVADEFKGTAVEKEVTAEEVAATNFYVLTDQNQFVWVKDAGTIAANKCWLEIAPSEAAGARRIVFSGSGTTGISTTDVTDYTDGTFYDLNGRKFIKKPTKKGIYIQNGKKVVIK